MSLTHRLTDTLSIITFHTQNNKSIIEFKKEIKIIKVFENFLRNTLSLEPESEVKSKMKYCFFVLF